MEHEIIYRMHISNSICNKVQQEASSLRANAHIRDSRTFCSTNDGSWEFGKWFITIVAQTIGEHTIRGIYIYIYMHLQPGEQIIIIIQWDLLELSMLLFAPNAHPFSFWTDSFTHISTYWDESRRLTISPISLFKLINGIEPVADSIYLVRAKSKFTRNECTQHNRCQMLIAFSIFYLTCFNSLSHYSRANTFACAGDGSSSTQRKH